MWHLCLTMLFRRGGVREGVERRAIMAHVYRIDSVVEEVDKDNV
jgi:hypothetical protein